MYPQKKMYSQMATAFGICFTVFTQMEDDPTVETTPPLQNLYRTCSTLCVILRQLPKKFLPYILVNMVYCLLGSVIIISELGILNV